MALLHMEEQPAAATRGETLATHYAQAIEFVETAIQAIKRGDSQGRSEAILYASETITALARGLDFTQAGGLTGRLYGMYYLQTRQLLEANRSDDIGLLDSVRGSLEILQSGWKIAARG